MGNEELARSIDESAKVVEVMTGVKAQFVAAGWSENMAERMTLQLLQSGSK